MAAMSDAEKAKVSRIFARKAYDSATNADLTHADIFAAVSSLDAAFEGLPAALPNQAQSVALNLNTGLPVPFKTTATTPQKSLLVALWAGVKYGYITSGGE